MKHPTPVKNDELRKEQVPRSEIADAVIRLRTYFKESQQIFATRLGLSIRSLAGYESDGRRPEDRVLALLAKTAVDADLPDIANDFIHEIGINLRLGEIRDGGIVSWHPLQKSGYMLVQIDDDQARDHAEAYYRTSRALLFGDKTTKAKAKRLLDRFTAEAAKNIPDRRPQSSYTRAMPTTIESLNREESRK